MNANPEIIAMKASGRARTCGDVDSRITRERVPDPVDKGSP